MAEPGGSPEPLVVTGPAQSVPVPTTSTGQKIVNWECDLAGWSLREETGTATAQVSIWDGSDTTGTRVAQVVLGSGGSESFAAPFLGIRCRSGIFLEVRSGTVIGTIWVRRVVEG